MVDYKMKLYKTNKDVKILIENFFSLSILQIVSYIFPILTLPYLANVIGVNKFGEIAFASAVIGYFQTIVDYGFNYTATRDIAKNKNDINRISEIFSYVMWSKALLAAISIIILLILIIIFPLFSGMKTLLAYSFLLIIGHILFPEWLFQGLEKMKYITILNVISKSIFTISIFVFIKNESDYIYQPLITSLGFIFSGLISIYIIIYKYHIKFLKPNVLLIKYTLVNSTDVFINSLFPNLYNSFSVLLLGFWGGPHANGILEAGIKFITISQQFILVISRTFFPYLSRNINKHNIFCIISITVSISICLVLFISSSLIIDTFYTKDFNKAVDILKILSISLVFLTLSNVYGTNYMIIQGHEKKLRNITIICSLIGFVIAWPLIYFYGYIGAAITISATRGVLGLTIMHYGLMIKKQGYRKLNCKI